MYSFLLIVRGDEAQEFLRAEAMDPGICEAVLWGRSGYPDSRIVFRLDPGLCDLDLLSIDNVVGARLCSARFIEALREEGALFTVYPVQVVDAVTQESLPALDSLWIAPEIEDAVDWERSESWTDPDIGTRSLTKLVLTPGCETAGHLVFVAGGTSRLLIHDRLRATLEDRNIRGVGFAPLDSAFDPDLGLHRAEIERRLHERPNDAGGWIELADIFRRLYRPVEGLGAGERALSLDPTSARALWTIAQCLWELGRIQEALEAFERATRAHPPGWGWAERSALLRQTGRFDEALAAAEACLRHRPGTPDCWYQVGAAHAARGQYQEALEAFDQVRVEPRDEVYLGKGEVLLQLGRYDEALATYDRAATFYPNLSSVWRGRVAALRALGRDGEAEMAAEEAQRWDEERERLARELPE